jgi:hypothetical protein
MKSLETFEITSFESELSEEIKAKAVRALEGGKVLYFPALPFALSKEELKFLTPSILDPKSKNISYDLRTDRLAGALGEAAVLKEMVKRYAEKSRKLLNQLIPHYNQTLIQAKTSFRPAEIFGRKTSYRKDDTRLHIDSFPSSPTKGERILRVFTNINPEGKARVWRLGEPFADVVQKMAPRASTPIWGVPHLLKLLGITKGFRTSFDHYMLQMHDTMKGDLDYQKTVPQEEIHFPPGSTWIVYTDQVSHAAMSGQHVLEQTFHLPLYGLFNEETAPLRVLEKFFNKSLV